MSLYILFTRSSILENYKTNVFCITFLLYYYFYLLCSSINIVPMFVLSYYTTFISIKKSLFRLLFEQLCSCRTYYLDYLIQLDTLF